MRGRCRTISAATGNVAATGDVAAAAMSQLPSCATASASSHTPDEALIANAHTPA